MVSEAQGVFWVRHLALFPQTLHAILQIVISSCGSGFELLLRQAPVFFAGSMPRFRTTTALHFSVLVWSNLGHFPLQQLSLNKSY